MSQFRIVLLVLIIVPGSVFAQTSLRLSGNVEDHATKEPLKNVSLSLKGSMIAVTNADGTFDVSIPQEGDRDTLIVSMLGYSQYILTVQELLRNSHVVVRLKSKSTLLKEVLVVDDRLTGKEILTTAFSKIEENFPVQPYLMKVFFRETYEENEKTVFLIDAVVDIEDDGYKAIYKEKGRLREKIRPQNIRASVPNFKSVFEVMHFSYLTYSLKWRNLKYREPDLSNAFGPHKSGKKKICEDEYLLDSVVSINNSAFYVVSYTHRIKDTSCIDIYYIDVKTFAIKTHIIKDKANEGFLLNRWNMGKGKSSYWYQNLQRDVVQEFELYAGKMYLKSIKGEFLAGIYNEKTKTTEYLLKTNETLLVQGIETENFEKVKDSIDPSQSLIEYKKNYDPVFWKNNENRSFFSLTKKQLRDLESETPLEAQFKKH
jgi:CarboxypepD_reg-like domain